MHVLRLFLIRCFSCGPPTCPSTPSRSCVRRYTKVPFANSWAIIPARLPRFRARVSTHTGTHRHPPRHIGAQRLSISRPRPP